MNGREGRGTSNDLGLEKGGVWGKENAPCKGRRVAGRMEQDKHIGIANKGILSARTFRGRKRMGIGERGHKS